MCMLLGRLIFLAWFELFIQLKSCMKCEVNEKTKKAKTTCTYLAYFRDSTGSLQLKRDRIFPISNMHTALYNPILKPYYWS